jgi:hypothetical protein
MGIDKTNEGKFTIVGKTLADQAESAPLGEEDDSFVEEGNMDKFDSVEDMDNYDDDSIGSYQSGEEGDDSDNQGGGGI